MARSFQLALFLVALAALSSRAATLDVPYLGGKMEQTVTIRTVVSNAYFSTSSLDGTLINFGNVFSVKLRLSPPEDNYTSFCSTSDSAVGKIFAQVSTAGEVRQAKDSSTVWDAFQTYPHDSATISLPALPLALDSSGAVGYRIGREIYCEGVGQYTSGNWNRLVFVHDGSVYAKFAISSKQDTLWGSGLPGYQYFKAVSLHYIINDSSDMTGLFTPVKPSGRRDPGSRLGGRIEHERYNPLGIRLNREPGRFEPTVPAPRKR